MGRLKTAPSRIKQAPSRLQYAPSPSEKRVAGRKLQSRRLRIWAKDPHCVDCGELTSYPSGFELDHDVALVNGGQDTDENSKVRCFPCHEKKTADDMRQARGA